jgi:uncharacterized membrane protein
MADYNEQEIKDGKIFAAVSYWSLLCILPFILKKDNSFAVYHAKQGLVLFIFLVAGFVVSVIPGLGLVLFRAVLFMYLVMLLWGTIGALAGKPVFIPVVSNLAKKIIL